MSFLEILPPTFSSKEKVRLMRPLNSIRRCIILVAVACYPLIAGAQSVELLQVNHRMRHASAVGDVAGATKWAEKALELGNKEFGPGSWDTAQLNLNLAQFLFAQEKMDEAAHFYQIALSIEEQIIGPEHPDLVPILKRLAESAKRRGDFVAAEKYLLRALGIERTVYGDNHPDTIDSLEVLATIYRAAQRDVEAEAVEAQARDLRDHLGVMGVLKDKDITRVVTEPASQRYPLAAEDGKFAIIPVFYATDRARTGERNVANFYGSERGKLEYGYLEVSIPASHKYGELETPRTYVFYRVRENPEKHVILQRVEPIEDKDAFLAKLGTHISKAPSREIFVYIHGYNVSFQNAARRAAQLAYDLNFDGTPMLYSWPSQNSKIGYFADEASVGVSARKLRVFLEDLLDQSGATRIHLIAHSMGNRALVEALEQLILRRKPDPNSPFFDQVILAAPDIDIDLFKAISPEIQKAAQRVTLYASSNDKALEYSATIHGGIPRAGSIVDNGREIVTVEGLDTIDMSEVVDRDDFGHSYYADDPATITDLALLMWRGVEPAKRCGMYSRPKNPLIYWKFAAAECRDKALLSAAVWVKRYGEAAREKFEQHLAAVQGAGRDGEKETWSRILQKIEELTTSK